MTQQGDAATAEILRLEDERCRAFQEIDEAAMSTLLSSDYTHVHQNGHMEDKQAFLSMLPKRKRSISRDDLQIRLHGDAAIMTGRMLTTRETDSGTQTMDAFTTQTFVVEDGAWKLAAMQVCPYTA
jgi:ketosteroid isomerase-like protein